MSVYDELLQFQILPDAFSDWQEYRAAVTGYITGHTIVGSSFAVFGAGICNDIDLHALAGHFSDITLFDTNLPALKEALVRYGQMDNPIFHLEHCEFSGITPEDYRSFSDRLSALLNVRGKDTDISMLADYASYALGLLYQKAEKYTPDFGRNRFDYAMAFGVHSQINNMAAWIWNTFCTNLERQDSTVENLIIRENDKLIPKLNAAILQATKKAAFFGCELANTAKAGSIQGACQCIRDLKDRGIITEQAITYWPFDLKQGIIYQMLIQCVDCTL